MPLERKRPTEIPTLNPLPEYLAEGQRLVWYQDMKSTLQVPWMGVVIMAFSHYPNFFAELWQGLKPISQSKEFVHACNELQVFIEQQTSELNPKNLLPELKEKGYAPREIEDIIAMNSIFSHGNQPYVLIATYGRYLLEGGLLSDSASATSFERQHAPKCSVPLVLMESHHADQQTQQVYEDIKLTLDLPFVNTDYRAFARWPSYFSLAWSDLSDKVGKEKYEQICSEFHHRCVELVAQTLPNPTGLSSEALQQAAAKDASTEKILQVCQLFQWLLPGLITNVAYFRHQLGAV